MSWLSSVGLANMNSVHSKYNESRVGEYFWTKKIVTVFVAKTVLDSLIFMGSTYGCRALSLFKAVPPRKLFTQNWVKESCFQEICLTITLYGDIIWVSPTKKILKNSWYRLSIRSTVLGVIHNCELRTYYMLQESLMIRVIYT